MSNDVQNMMLKDSKDLLDNVEITTIAAECVKLKAKEDEIATLEEQLKAKKAEADQGLSELKLQDGSKVSVKKEFRATIPKDEARRESCLQWLRDQGLGDIIKNNVIVSFGKGEDDKAEQMLNLAAEHGFNPQQKSDVAWNTLTALYQERVQAGLDMPSDSFSLWIKDKTKISRK